MKIKLAEVAISKGIEPGRFVYVVNFDEAGVFVDLDNIVIQASAFNRILIKGSPFVQKESFHKFIKKVIKNNPKIVIEIYSDCHNRPFGLMSVNNINYNVYFVLSKSGSGVNDRLNKQAINWFVTKNANFIFNVEEDDDVDEMLLLISEFDIDKSNVFMYGDNNDFLYNVATTLGINICEVKP